MNDPDTFRTAEPSRPLLFARVREMLGAAASRALGEALIAIAHDLEHGADALADGRERQAMLAAAVQLGRDPLGRAARIPDELSRRVLRCLEAAKAGKAEGAPLALLGQDALEAQILAGALAAAIREETGAQYDDYVNRVRRISAGQWAEDDANPLGARTIASALVSAVAGVAETAGTRLALRQALARHVAPPVAAAIASADAMLEAEGVSGAAERPPAEAAGLEQDDWGPEPETSPERETPPTSLPPAAPPPALGARAEDRQALAAPQPPRKPEESAAESSGEPAVGVADRVAALDRDAAALGTSPLPALRAPPSGAALSVLQPVVDLERDAVALAHAAGLAPYSREARGEFFGRARGGLSRAGASPAQLAVVDVVAALFDYVVDDRRMPEPAKPLVWRLQQPALALSLLDPGYLGDEPRSLRRLVEHVGAISVAFADDLTRGSELHRRLETIVRAVEVVTGALQTRSSVIARQVEREYARAAQHVGQLIERVARERQALEAAPDRRNRRDYSRRPGPDRERLVTERIRELIEQKLADSEVPESVRDFLHKVWLRHARTAALRSGEDSTDFRVAMQVVDDLVWSLDVRDGGSRRELAERIPPLIRLIGQGVSEIGAKDDEFRAFFDELFLIHLRRMQRGHRRALAQAVAPRPPEPAPPGEAPDRRLLEILGTLDLDDLPPQPRRLPLEAAEAFEQLGRGDWVELTGRDDKPSFAKVAWINQRRTVALLVRRDDRRAISIRMEELRDRFARGRAFLIASSL
ncbi:DUF1631 domain-containing protein [Burkholderiaceae bacterium FT117]|uniref:DUF1631 family protein n=1 Tax=Zeimonas sediminis TaxID=2944268 RepID=UPI0023430147|nr:DUF1631 family protein [Zeimonas sediminis]MCM5569345.1 DUF1631 domain-containing protein [Zeimonas sediminis]